MRPLQLQSGANFWRAWTAALTVFVSVRALGPEVVAARTLALEGNATSHAAIPNGFAPPSQVHHLTPADLELLHQMHRHVFAVPKLVLEMGVHRGSNWRMRRFVHKLVTGQPVTVAAIGGSVTACYNCTKDTDFTYLAQFVNWLREVFPNNKIKQVNGAVGGTRSLLALHCSENYGVDPNTVDLLFVEYILNDGLTADPGKSFWDMSRAQMYQWEQVYRKYLNFPTKPAVIHMACSYLQAPLFTSENPYFITPEDQYNVVAQYYAQSSLSLRNVLYQMAQLNDTYLNGTFNAFSWYRDDLHHPTALGHRVMADLAVLMVQQATVGMLSRRFSDMDERMANAPLPRHMYPGNVDFPRAICILPNILPSVVVDAKGFEYKDEGIWHKRMGYIGTEPGSYITIKVQGQPSVTQPLTILHLKSYAHMGKAKVECIADCTCDPPTPVVDGNTTYNWSQMLTTKVGRINTTTGACTLRFTILNETNCNTGEHKFKLGGVILGGTVDELLSINPHPKEDNDKR